MRNSRLMASATLALLTVFFLLSTSWAQELDTVTTEKKKRRSAMVICAMLPKNLPNPVFSLDGRKTSEVILSHRSPSEVVSLPKEKPFQLVIPKGAGGIDVEKPDSYRVIASKVIPSTIQDALLVLVPLKKPDPTRPGIAFDISIIDQASFGGGEQLFVNLSDTKLAIQVGEQRKLLPAGRSIIMDPGVNDEPQNFDIGYYRYRADEKEWAVITTSIIAVYPTRREVCIFYNRNSNGSIGFRGITCPAE